jgi:hypothetical protein
LFPIVIRRHTQQCNHPINQHYSPHLNLQVILHFNQLINLLRNLQ